MKKLVLPALAGLALLASAVCGAEPQAMPAYKPTFMKKWFGIGPEPPKPPPPIRRDPAIEASNARANAEADLLRRQAACDALRKIAYESNRPELEEQAMQLEEKAWEIYRKQTAHLPCNRLVPEKTEGLASRRLGIPEPTAAADRLEATKPTDLGKKAQASTIREIKP